MALPFKIETCNKNLAPLNLLLAIFDGNLTLYGIVTSCELYLTSQGLNVTLHGLNKIVLGLILISTSHQPTNKVKVFTPRYFIILATYNPSDTYLTWCARNYQLVHQQLTQLVQKVVAKQLIRSPTLIVSLFSLLKFNQVTDII